MSPSRALRLAFLTAFAISLYVIESAIPKPLPFMRLGLANVIVLLVLAEGCPREALIIGITKSLAGGLVTGTLLSPTTLMSLSGTLVSFLAMWGALYTPLGLLGIGVTGAVTHNLVQLSVVRMVMIRSNSIFTLTPWLILLGIATGILSGAIAHRLQGKIRVLQPESPRETP
jgi:heptaprenyl diphosphate synthase